MKARSADLKLTNRLESQCSRRVEAKGADCALNKLTYGFARKNRSSFGKAIMN